ncbi:MAG TPA: response regulator transcription factor [Candidatus Omnitrophota bacterium]|nr:response regulator transcription factor [Candidatus Omnitrophota bacterium]
MAKKILLIEDDLQVLELLKVWLAAHDYSVEMASNGEEGLRKLKDTVPDLIILDVFMPRMDGYSFLMKMKEENPLIKVPIIVLTGKDKMRDLFEMEGVVAYVVKPFSPEELLGKIKQAFETGAAG